jgi:phosphoribosylanthranilate isomerase
MKVKICGIKRLEDALQAAEAGADMIGLNFYEPSPRYLEPQAAAQLSVALRARLGERCPLIVGVFVNASAAQVAQIVEQVGLDYAQLSGDESPEVAVQLAGRAFKSIRPPDADAALRNLDAYIAPVLHDQRIPSVLLDAYHPSLYGGTGEQARADLVSFVRERVPRMMLAGGLTPDNVAERVQQLRPWGVDVASGVEGAKPGEKSAERVQAFIRAARTV